MIFIELNKLRCYEALPKASRYFGYDKPQKY